MNSKTAYCSACKETNLFQNVRTGVSDVLFWTCLKCNTLSTTRQLDDAFLGIAREERKARKEALLTLPTDSQERKSFPILSGCLKYFAAALAGVSRTSKVGNDKHNPGEELHHARGKSMDHGDCIVRHLIDVEDLLAARKRGFTSVSDQQILEEASSLAWRALAYSQELHERLGAAPMASGAK